MALSYRDCGLQIIERAERIAADKNVSVEVVLAVQKASWADEEALEREQATARADLNAEREAASHRLPEVLNSMPPGSRWPSAKDIIGQVGLPPTKSHLGWLAYQLRLAKPTAMAAE